MTIMQKASLTVSGNDLHMAVPFAKVDKEKRLVSGFATLDNEDTQGDVVTAEASLKAFARARGNLREMHEKIAAGRIVDFKEDEFYHEGKFYRGIFVTAYISKGAESTWEKVLDGTLSGFSIGGEVIDSDSEFVKDAGKTVRFIKDYDLIELSLVDNPANPLANVFSFQKAANGSVTGVTGMVAEADIENVFYCKVDALIQSKVDDSATCPECGNKMEIAGWFENAGDRAEKVKSVIAKFLAAHSDDSEGGVNKMARGDETTETGHEAGDPSEVPTPATPAQDVAPETTEDSEEVDETAGTEESSDVVEVTDDEEEITKMIDSLKDDLREVIVKSVKESKDETAHAVETLRDHIEEFKKSVDAKISELDENYRAFSEKVGKDIEVTKDRLAGVEGALEKFNSAEALRKSSEPSSETRVQKPESIWNGAFSLDNVLRK